MNQKEIRDIENILTNMLTDYIKNTEEIKQNSDYCVECNELAYYIYRGDSLCEKHFSERKEYNKKEE